MSSSRYVLTRSLEGAVRVVKWEEFLEAPAGVVVVPRTEEDWPGVKAVRLRALQPWEFAFHNGDVKRYAEGEEFKMLLLSWLQFEEKREEQGEAPLAEVLEVVVEGEPPFLEGEGPGRPPEASTAAREFLLEALAAGPVPATEISERSAALGVSKRTLERVKAELGIESYREGFGPNGRLFWRLPESEEK